MHRPVGPILAIFAGAVHGIDDPHPAFVQPRGIVLLFFGKQAIFGALLAQGMAQELIGTGIPRLAQCLQAEHAGRAHLLQQPARHLGQMRGEITVGETTVRTRAHIVGIQ